jgi:deazaflavin-dependent oxidoreductase (nitroreductase family)
MSDANEWNKAIIEEFRANEGQVGGYFENTPLLLLHTTGAKSGEARINPAAYIAAGERLVVLASKAGAPTNPDWYYNLVANPAVSVEVGTEQFQAQATVATEPERTKLFEQMVAANPGFAEYEQKAAPRIIPVIILTRKS